MYSTVIYFISKRQISQYYVGFCIKVYKKNYSYRPALQRYVYNDLSLLAFFSVIVNKIVSNTLQMLLQTRLKNKISWGRYNIVTTNMSIFIRISRKLSKKQLTNIKYLFTNGTNSAKM